MGADCCGTPDPGAIAAKIPHLDTKYKELNLPETTMNHFKNKFEKEFFMTVNLLRADPTTFQTYIKNYMATGNSKIHPVASKVLINKLKELGTGLKAIELNEDASNACFTNLKRTVT